MGSVDGAGVAADVEVGDGGAGVDMVSGGGVKMPIRCLASRSFSSLAAFAAALSCWRLTRSSSRSLSRSRSISSVMPKRRLILADDLAASICLLSSNVSSSSLSALRCSI